MVLHRSLTDLFKDTLPDLIIEPNGAYVYQHFLPAHCYFLLLKGRFTHIWLFSYVKMLFVDYNSAFNPIVSYRLDPKQGTQDSIAACAAGSWTVGSTPGGEDGL